MHLETINTNLEKNFDVQDLVCPVCMTVADDPYVSLCCQRVFCSKDSNPERYENGCPLCRQSNLMFQSSAKHKALVEKLTIKCQCSERILPEEYNTHRERCSNITFPCPHGACQEKNQSIKYNSQQLVNHLALAHCDEVPILGSTYVNKNSIEPYKKAAIKYEELVSTLYSLLYPKMIDAQIKTNQSLSEKSAFLHCPQRHKLIKADASLRKRKNGSNYSSPGFNCDTCLKNFSAGTSWHCSCTDTGYDKCVSCLAFELYEINDNVLHQASQDNEEQQRRFRQLTTRNTVRLPRGLFRLLTAGFDVNDDEGEDDDDDDDDARNESLFSTLRRAQFQNADVDAEDIHVVQ